MLNWLRKLLGNAPPCEACEAYRGEIEHLRFQNKQFMDNLLVKAPPVTEKEPIPISRPKALPWPVRRAMLEKDDRERAERIRAEARAKAGAGQPDTTTTTPPTPVDVEDLEREMDLVQKERESNGTQR